MKISEMSTDQVADILVKIAKPVSDIMEDSKVADLMKDISASKDVPYIKLFASMVPKIVSIALVDHREDLFAIVGAMEGKSVSDVKKQNILKTIKALQESIDKDLIDFFGSTFGQGEIVGNE